MTVAMTEANDVKPLLSRSSGPPPIASIANVRAQMSLGPTAADDPGGTV
jgi:hypothetical protein